MAIRKINPTSPGQRGMTKSDYQEITTSTPEKSLLKKLNKTLNARLKSWAKHLHHLKPMHPEWLPV